LCATQSLNFPCKRNSRTAIGEDARMASFFGGDVFRLALRWSYAADATRLFRRLSSGNFLRPHREAERRR
jgi:hypothetical protein